MTKTEKKVLAIILVALVVLVVNFFIFSRLAIREIEQKGLKGIVNEIWEGSK